MSDPEERDPGEEEIIAKTGPVTIDIDPDDLPDDEELEELNAMEMDDLHDGFDETDFDDWDDGHYEGNGFC